MSVQTERRSPSEQPMYIVWMIMFVVAFELLQLLVLAGLYCGIYGAPTFSEWVTFRVPEYSHTVLRNGKVWYPVVIIGPNQPPGKAVLTSFDPETGDTVESKITVPFPITGLLVKGDQMWVVSPNAVVFVVGDQATEFKPKRLLNRPCEPFLYENQLAVIDVAPKMQPKLLGFQNNEWVELGDIAIPTALATADVDGKQTLVQSPATTVTGQTLLEVQVVSSGNTFHVFVSDGVSIACHTGLELATPSALAPANVPGLVDLSDLADWELVCRVPPQVGIRSKTTWKAVFVDGEPVVINVGSSNPQANRNPFQEVLFRAYRRVEGTWQKTSEISSPAAMDFLAVSDGQKSYVAAQSITGFLRFYRLADLNFHSTGVVMKPSANGIQQALQHWVVIYRWIFWIGMLPFVMGVSRLMSWYRNPVYQFGDSTVELASVTRRGVARAIDHVLYVVPCYFITVAFGLSDQEQVEKNVDRMFDWGPNGMMTLYAWMLLSIALCGLFILCVNSWLQGRWGVTVGKWLCGIRTVRATLRPCGFLRAMLRELLLAADLLMGITALPGTLMIAFTNCHQRIGDLIADTIVIRKPAEHDPFVTTNE